jgi:ABC-type lipoprotein release transport system permease subunit
VALSSLGCSPAPLYEISPLDPWIFTLMPLLLLAVALWAGYVPVRRAALLDPVRALTEN